MKKIVYLAFLVVALSVEVSASVTRKDDNKEPEVSFFAENNFSRKYQNATEVTWTVSKEFQKASFVQDGVKMNAFFDQTGEYIATTQYVEAEKLPAISKKRIEKFYNGYVVEEVVKYDFDDQNAFLNFYRGQNNYNTLYFVSLKKDEQKVVVKVTPDGDVAFLKNL